MVYCHMIYSPETDKQYDNEFTVHDGLIISVLFICMDKEHLQRTLSNPHSVHDGSSL